MFRGDETVVDSVYIVGLHRHAGIVQPGFDLPRLRDGKASRTKISNDKSFRRDYGQRDMRR